MKAFNKYAGRPLGENQAITLRSLKERGPWYPTCGWHWNGPSGTRAILDSLVRRGLVIKDGDTYKLKE